jgi:transposase
MHPITSIFLAGERIADLHRDADRRRQASAARRPGSATIHHRPSATRPAFSGTPVTETCSTG